MNTRLVPSDHRSELYADESALNPLQPVGVILLAAGKGTRYLASLPRESRNPGAGPHKLLALLPDGRRVGQASAQAVRAQFATVLAVVRPDQLALSAMFEACGCQVLVTEDAQRGMGASLAVGARWFEEKSAERGAHRYRGCLVALADMPWLAEATLVAVAAHVAGDKVVAPYFNGQRGHPMGFGARRLSALAQLDGDTGARDLLRDWPQCKVDVDDPGILLDVDTASDIR